MPVMGQTSAERGTDNRLENLKHIFYVENIDKRYRYVTMLGFSRLALLTSCLDRVEKSATGSEYDDQRALDCASR
jgi:hypothetical protein